MLTFEKLWENMRTSTVNPLMDSNEIDSKSEEIIRAGNQLRKEGEKNFWEDFLTLLSNNEGIAQLLNVKTEDVLQWPSRIQEARKSVDAKNQESPEDEDKQIIPTGDSRAVSGNSDPIL
jgi:hypothetical protein